MRLLSALVILPFAILVSCRSSGGDSNTMELRTYEVPKGTVRTLTSTIDHAFYLGPDKSLGRATVTPDGRVAVLAPQNVQANVQQLIDDIAKHPPTFEQTMELHYWVVLGKPSKAPEPPPVGANEIQPALDEIVKSQGPQSFTIAKSVRLSSLHDDDSEVESEELKVKQKAVQTNEGLYARIAVAYGKHDKLDTRVHLTRDKIVILGATGQHGDGQDGSTLYYVVRVAPR
jgi:hypothetical protein